MKHPPQPEWKPIEFLPTYTILIRGLLESAQEQYVLLREALQKPYVLDDNTMNRTLTLYTQQKEDHWLWEKQVDLWQQGDLSMFQRQSLKNLKKDVDELGCLNDKILTLARKIQPHTIDRVLTQEPVTLAFDPITQRRFNNERWHDEMSHTIERMKKLEDQFQGLKQTLKGIFCRFIPQISPHVTQECIKKIGARENQLQNIALRATLGDYCLFHHLSQGKTPITAFIDRHISSLTDEEILALHSFQKAKFAVLEVKALLVQNAIAVYDLLEDEFRILFDEGLYHHNLQPGFLIVCHLVQEEGFVMTTDAAIVIGHETQCGQLLLKKINEIKQEDKKEDDVTKILQIVYGNL